MAYHEESSASGQDEPWIQWFCSLKGHEMFCKVERSYIEDGFNLYGLRAFVANFSDCLDLILDRIGPDDSDDSHLTQSACTLYGLIHARYIITAHGLDAMYNKYANKEFGTCSQIQCYGQPVLPIGLHDDCGMDHFKIFCPKCQNVYHPPPYMRIKNGESVRGREHQVDGASFGTTFPHLFLMTFNNLAPDRPSPSSAYVPRVFGFRLHSSSKQRITANSNTNSGAASANSNSNAAATNGNSNSQAVSVAASAASASNANVNANANANRKKSAIAEGAKPVAAASAAGASGSGVAGEKDAKEQSSQSQAQSKGKKGKPRRSKSEDGGAGNTNSKRRPGKTSNGDDTKKRQKRP